MAREWPPGASSERPRGRRPTRSSSRPGRRRRAGRRRRPGTGRPRGRSRAAARPRRRCSKTRRAKTWPASPHTTSATPSAATATFDRPVPRPAGVAGSMSSAAGHDAERGRLAVLARDDDVAAPAPGRVRERQVRDVVDRQVDRRVDRRARHELRRGVGLVRRRLDHREQRAARDERDRELAAVAGRDDRLRAGREARRRAARAAATPRPARRDDEDVVDAADRLDVHDRRRCRRGRCRGRRATSTGPSIGSPGMNWPTSARAETGASTSGRRGRRRTQADDGASVRWRLLFGARRALAGRAAGGRARWCGRCNR